MFLLACLYECQKNVELKINLSVPLKIKMSPKIFAKGTECPPSNQILAQTLALFPVL